MNRKHIEINLSGLDELEDALEKVERKQRELADALGMLRAVRAKIELSINQPPAQTGD